MLSSCWVACVFRRGAGGRQADLREGVDSPGALHHRSAPREPERAMTQYPALHMIIDGEKVSGGGRRTFDVVNPVTGEAIGALPLAEAGDLDRALDVAQRGFKLWRKSTPQDRAAVLQGAARLMV